MATPPAERMIDACHASSRPVPSAESGAAASTRTVRRGRYTLRLNAEESLIRAILVESIDCLFSDIDETQAAGQSHSMDEPLLDQINDQRVQFHGQLTAPPRVRRRQKLVASRAVLHAVVRR